MKIQVIIGSIRPNRFSEKSANWIFAELKKRPEVEAELVDLKDYPLPFYNESLSPSMAKGEYTNEVAKKWLQKISEGDGYIMVTPEYNHAPSGVLKNAIDWVYYEWNRKPVAFVSHGSAGGIRAVEQLREIVGELQMADIRSTVMIFAPRTLMDEQGNLKTETLQPMAEKMLDDLIWWTKALKDARDKQV